MLQLVVSRYINTEMYHYAMYSNLLIKSIHLHIPHIWVKHGSLQVGKQALYSSLISDDILSVWFIVLRFRHQTGEDFPVCENMYLSTLKQGS